MVFALCGGDKRIARLATLLIEDGYGVRAWALEDAPLIDGVRRCGTAEECVNGAGCIVLPMPCAPQRGMLSTPLSPRRHCLGELFAAVPPGALVCAGSVTEEVRTLAEERGARLRDYGALESFRAANSAATAEGTIGELLHETPGLLCGCRAVITGCGRITRALAPRLAALGMRVTVSSRSADSLAWAWALGFSAVPLEKLETALNGADVVINTAPALVLTASRLTELPEGALVLDLASKPGGTDFDAARAFGIRALSAPGLPGKWSPDAAAGAVRDAIYRIMEDEKL